MPKNEVQQHRILIVSNSEKFDAIVKNSLDIRRFLSLDVRKSAAAARQCVLERDYDLMVVNCPLPDEFGTELADFVAEKSTVSILLVCPVDVSSEVADRMADQGVMVLGKPFYRDTLKVDIRILTAFQERLWGTKKQLEAAESKSKELLIIYRAKLLLMENQGLTEDEAHRYLGRLAMNMGISRKRAAEQIVEEYE